MANLKEILGLYSNIVFESVGERIVDTRNSDLEREADRAVRPNDYVEKALLYFFAKHGIDYLNVSRYHLYYTNEYRDLYSLEEVEVRKSDRGRSDFQKPYINLCWDWWENGNQDNSEAAEDEFNEEDEKIQLSIYKVCLDALNEEFVDAEIAWRFYQPREIRESIGERVADDSESSIVDRADDLLLPKDYIERAIIAVFQKHKKFGSGGVKYFEKRGEDFYRLKWIQVQIDGKEYGKGKNLYIENAWHVSDTEGELIDNEYWESFDSDGLKEESRLGIYKQVCEFFGEEYVSPKVMCFQYNDSLTESVGERIEGTDDASKRADEMVADNVMEQALVLMVSEEHGEDEMDVFAEDEKIVTENGETLILVTVRADIETKELYLICRLDGTERFTERVFGEESDAVQKRIYNILLKQEIGKVFPPNILFQNYS